MKTCECGKPAAFLCDGRVPLTREETLRRFKAGEHINRETMSCDAPMCGECRTNVGTIAACLRGKGCEVGSVDHCHRCVTKARLGLA